MDVDVSPKYVANVFLLGLLVNVIMLGVSSLFGAIGIQLVWTDLLGIILSLAVVPFIYGTVIHGIDSVLGKQDFRADDTPLLIWIVGVIVAFILVGIISLLALFGVQPSLTDFTQIVLYIAVFSWVTGVPAKVVDDYLTEG